MKYNVTQQEATISAAEFIDRYRDIGRFLELCSQCKNYNKMWCCPLFDNDAATMSDGFKTVSVLGTVITFDDETVNEGKDSDKAKIITDTAIHAVMKSLLLQMYSLEAEVPGSRCFTFRCMLCHDVCTRPFGKPCRHPDKMRYSLEAVGFDVTAISHDLLGIDLEWSTNGSLSRRITLVTAVFRP